MPVFSVSDFIENFRGGEDLAVSQVGGLEFGTRSTLGRATSIAAPPPIAVDLNFQGIDDDTFLCLSQFLKKFNGVERLELFGNVLTDISVSAICEIIEESSRAVYLNVGGNAFSSDALRLLSPSLSRLRSLSLSNGAVEASPFLSASLSASAAQEMAGALERATSLTQLALSGNNLGTDAVKLLCGGLAVSQGLRELHLDSNAIGEDGAAMIGSVIAKSPGLRRLNVSRNNVAAGAKAILAALCEERAGLEDLDMSTNNVTDECGSALQDTLERCSSLRRLHLSDNFLSNPSMEFIARGLQKNSTLQALSLSMNAFGDKAARAMKVALTKNRTLTSLDVSSNAIRNSGGRGLAEVYLRCVAKGGALKELRLEGNHVGSNVLKAIELVDRRDLEGARELIQTDSRRYREELKERERRATEERREKERVEKEEMRRESEGNERQKVALSRFKKFVSRGH